MTHTVDAAPQVPEPTFRVLGTRVDVIQIPAAILRIQSWIATRQSARYVAVTGMHGVMEARRDAYTRQVLQAADLVVPDGMSLVWVGRFRGHASLQRRVYGPELMQTFFEETRDQYRHFFFGAGPGVPERLAERYRTQYGARIVGTFSPPFRPMTPDEEAQLAARISEARPDILWVGLSTPKQEKWMYEHRSLPVPAMVGVGAAFDFNCGNVSQAPTWMRENGLEWLFRLLTNPRRLWYRYLVLGSSFAGNVTLELLGLRTYE